MEVRRCVNKGICRWYKTSNPRLPEYFRVADKRRELMDCIYCWSCDEYFAHIKNARHPLRHRETCPKKYLQPANYPNSHGTEYNGNNSHVSNDEPN